jgi:transcription antitermination factor NusG
MGGTNWYAIRLKPNAQRLSKQDARLTNIEWSLSQEGIEHYLPQERREIIHHRTKKPIDKRYPLIPGYAFVCGVDDWLKLHKCDFVAGVLGVRGTPMSIRSSHVEAIMAAEEKIREDYEKAKAFRRQKERERDEHIPQRRLRVMFPAGSTISIDGSHSMLAGMRGRVVDATGRQTIKAMIETLNGMVNAEIPVSYIEKVA